MYMQQMLCLVTAAYNREEEFSSLVESVRTELDRAFDRLCFVHFASLAVLPPPPDAPSETAMMLELAIDDGIAPRDAVLRLIDAAPGVLWKLYESSQPPSDPRMPLRAKLVPLADAARATGGFVGMRDRSATQVRAEARWFLIARKKLHDIRDKLVGSGKPFDASGLVHRLKIEMANDAGSAAMQRLPPRSTWCVPRRPLGHLSMVLGWLVVPIPLLVCLVALVGALARLVVEQPVLETSVLTLGGSAAVALLLLMFTAYYVFRKRSIAVLVALAAVSGVIVFYAALVAGYLRFATGNRQYGAAALIALPVVLGVLFTLWRVWRSPPRAAVSGWIGLLVAGVGAILSSYLVGATWNHESGIPDGLPWSAAAYLGPLLIALFLIIRSSAARWYFGLGVPLIVGLLVLESLSFTLWPSFRDVVWDGVENLKLHVALGVLALLGSLMLAAIALDLVAMLQLRSPFAPLGVPMAALLTLLLVAYFAVCAAAHALLGETLDPWVALSRWGGYVWIALSLALAGLLVLTLRWFVESALPALDALVSELHRMSSDRPFLPFAIPKRIVENEAKLVNRPGHMISLTDVRGPRKSRAWLAIWLWLHVVGEVGHAVYTNGLLGTAGGLKFTHWHLVQDGRRLLFVSNFDGDFGGYLDEFINGTAEGINLIWRWTHVRERNASGPDLPATGSRAFPDTTGFAFGGCRREQEFKAYARSSMLPHVYLYQAYDYSNDEIERHTQLRAALAGERTPANDDVILRILES